MEEAASTLGEVILIERSQIHGRFHGLLSLLVLSIFMCNIAASLKDAMLSWSRTVVVVEVENAPG